MKQWANITHQVQKHVSRGLKLDDVSEQEFALFLYSNNYYRVSGYAHCFYENNSGRYSPDFSARMLMDVYDLDRRVRNLVLDGVSVLEPTLKSRITYHVTQSIHGGDGYQKEDFYNPPPRDQDDRGDEKWEREDENRRKVLQAFGEVTERKEKFIKHFVEQGEPIPLWAAIEVIPLGTFSRFVRSLRDAAALDCAAKSLELEDREKLMQAIQNIAFIRNISAHHGRLWNRKFDGWVTLPAVALRVKRGYLHPKTPAAALTLLAGMVDQVEKSSSFSEALLDLVHENHDLAEGYYRPIL